MYVYIYYIYYIYRAGYGGAQRRLDITCIHTYIKTNIYVHIHTCIHTYTIYTIYTEPDTEGRGGGWTLDALALAKLVQSGRDVSVQHGARWRLVAQQTLQVSLHICRLHMRKETYKETNICHARFVTHR